MLKAMRESPFKDKLMSGGRGGEAFTSMLDQHLAEHMARSSDSKLVRSIARKLERNTARQGAVAPKPDEADQNPNENARNHVAAGLRA
jgi:Rod binding domain-containing protein